LYMLQVLTKSHSYWTCKFKILALHEKPLQLLNIFAIENFYLAGNLQYVIT